MVCREEVLVNSVFLVKCFFHLLSNRNQADVTLKFTSRFLHPSEASLLLISKSKHAVGGTTMTFALKGEVLNFKGIVSNFTYFVCLGFSSQAIECPKHSFSSKFYISVQLLFFEIMSG